MLLAAKLGHPIAIDPRPAMNRARFANLFRVADETLPLRRLVALSNGTLVKPPGAGPRRPQRWQLPEMSSVLGQAEKLLATVGYARNGHGGGLVCLRELEAPSSGA